MNTEVSTSFLLFGDLHPSDTDGQESPGSVPEQECFSYLMPADGPAAQRAEAIECAALPRSCVLGRGQYGVVWCARSRATGHLYAIKTIDAERGLDKDQGRQETAVAELLRDQPHPCLARLFQVHCFDDGSLCMLVMEFCPGGDLQSQIRAARTQAKSRRAEYAPPELARMWVSQVFMGLAHLHLKVKLLMRDLKPANVLICGNDWAKLTDFGLSRVGVQATGQSFAFPAGTMGFIAPEVAHGLEYDYGADLYSLGVLVWVILTGGGSEGGDQHEDDDCEPRPPNNGGIDDDWEVLERRLAEVTEDVSRDFVSRLTQRVPDQKLSHAEVRDHRFFSKAAGFYVEMPAPDADASDVAAWMEQSLAEYRASLAARLGDKATLLEDFLLQPNFSLEEGGGSQLRR